MVRDIAIKLIDTYQRYMRGLQPECCRFYPSCSEYAKQAILRYGFFRGSFKAGKRICQCHPWSGKSGYNPLT